MGLNNDKTSKVFCINICCFFLPDFIFLYHIGTNSSKFRQNCDVFDHYTPINQNVHCAVSGNDQCYKETVLR